TIVQEVIEDLRNTVAPDQRGEHRFDVRQGRHDQLTILMNQATSEKRSKTELVLALPVGLGHHADHGVAQYPLGHPRIGTHLLGESQHELDKSPVPEWIARDHSMPGGVKLREL